MKRNILYPLAVVLLLVVALAYQSVRYNRLLDEYGTSVQNNKAYQSQLDAANERNRVFVFEIEQLEYINDSTIRQLDSMRRELDIKDSRIRQMGKVREYVYITDSIVLHDTIFRDPCFVLDTCLGDEWYDNDIHMEYPNRISSTICVNTDQNVFLHVTRETVNTPCKTWIGRLFQRKHDVYNVTVIENNPYANIKENKFVIIK